MDLKNQTQKREIKFRITYQHDDTGRITQRFIELGQPIPHIGERWFVIARDQFTGLKDKNGKEIYEGDIVKYGTDKPNPVIFYNQMFCVPVGGSEHKTHLHIMGGYNKWEVIGNIYENPELLNQ